MKRGLTGHYVTISTLGGERADAFVPDPLPPTPPLDMVPGLQEAIERALVSLGRLDGVRTLLPDPDLFLYTYVRKEAVLSSQIEGTQSSLSDLLLFELDELPGVPLGDVQEVSSYVSALQHGLKRIRGGFPISNRLLREVHAKLLAHARGSTKMPGEFRRSQNWIGGTRPGNAAFVPPPHERVDECMAALERFIHDDPRRTPPLLKAALAHVQLETIHPFLDGNGRVGRLLITLLLCAEEILQEPLLYLSLHFKEHRARYYELLELARREGDWESWLQFFAEAVDRTAEGAVETAGRLTRLFQRDRERVEGLSRGAGSALRVQHHMEQRPMATIARLRRSTGLSTPTVTKALDRLAELDIVEEVTGRKRDRVFAYRRYIALLSQGTTPLR